MFQEEGTGWAKARWQEAGTGTWKGAPMVDATSGSMNGRYAVPRMSGAKRAKCHTGGSRG